MDIPPFLGQLDHDAESAWTEFVHTYSSTIVATAGRYISDEDERMDAYVYVLEALVSNDSRAFRRYLERAREHDIPFDAWLRLVTKNLCLDFLRHSRGRRFLPRSVQRMSRFDQILFRCLYWEGMSYGEALDQLRARVDHAIAFAEVAARASAMANVIGAPGDSLALGASRRDARFASLDDPEASSALEVEATEAARTAGSAAGEAPDLHLDQLETEASLRTLLATLREDERLILALRYEEGLNAAQIASYIGAPSTRAVYKKLARVIEKLRAAISPAADDINAPARGENPSRRIRYSAGGELPECGTRSST